MDYDHLDPSGSLMEQIQALIQPPQSENQAKKTRKVDKDCRKPGRSVNHDNCDSCGEGGDLLCCDRCPCAFHLSCCDPPLEEDDIPDGEWLCIECKADPARNSVSGDKPGDKKEDNEKKMEVVEEKKEENGKNQSPFSTLVKLSSGKNPTTFSLPPELKCNTIFPGDRKRRNSSDEKVPPAKNGKRNGEEDDGSLCSRLCFQCSRTEQCGQLVQCDFCPLAFHADCVNPPLTTIPNGMWMCPNHAEHAEPGLRDPRFTKRCQAYNDLRNNVSQHTIKLNFLKKVRRIKTHPAFRKKGILPTRRRASLVPQAIKDHYSSPPLMYLPEHVRKMQEPLPMNELLLSTPSTEDQEEWLRGIINLQCSIAKHLSQTVTQKLPAVSQSTVLMDNHPNLKTETSTTSSATKDNITTTSTSTTSTLVHTSTVAKSTVSSANDTTVCSSTTKSEMPNSVPTPNSSNTVPNACLSRVVTTTITTSSGGKTVTKPLTILYASPSKLAPHVNGHVTANCSKPVCSTVQGSQSTNVTATLNAGGSTAKVVVKQERKSSLSNDIGHSAGTSSSNTEKLLNDVAGHLNNIKPKLPLDGVRTPAATTSGSSGSGTVSNSTAKSLTLSPASVALTSSAGIATGATKLASASTPTKLIVLTSGTGGNIIKTIASAGFAGGAAQLPSGAIVSLATGSTTGSGSLRSVVGNLNPGSTNLSPGRILQGASSATPVATSSAINNICAAAGVDAFSETELGKLDPRLIQVLAYQRLQQLLTQAKPVPPSPVAARKITFNGLKESLLLPQQTLPIGKTIAVLCPLTGTGPMSPMIHKCLTIGQGTDVDVCLQDYGHCNFVSEKHFCIFYDGSSKQYELINYSEHGTYVDNVLYSCDFSDKPNRQVTSTKDLDPKKVSKERLLTAAQEKQNPKPRGARRTVGLGVQKISKTCNCTTSSSNLIGGSGAGWEGTALLHHGSYIKVGCMQFIFSIANHANKIPNNSKTRSATVTSTTPTKTAVSS